MAQIKVLASRSHHYFTLNVDEVASSINVNNNTSDVSYSFVLSPKVKGYNWSIGQQITYTVTINGSTVATGHIPSYNGSSTVTLSSGTVTIPHNNDGTKTINIGFNVTDSTSYSFTCGNASGSDTLSLTTIPRASQITVADANIGSSTNITINKNSSSFTTTLYYKASGQSSYTKIVDKTSNQVYGWTVPTSFYALIPNSKTITCQFYAETYNGSTLVGTSNVVTATFTATGSPTINSCTLRSTDSTTTNLVGNTRMIRYISTVTANVSASGRNSATISSIKVNGVTATNNVATFTKATTNSFQVIVTDSRGYSTTNTYTMTWTNYVQLTLNATISRNEPTDGKVNISFRGNYFNGNFTGSSSIANTLTVQYRSREAGGTWGSWTTISHTKSGNTYSGSTQLSNYDYTKQYEFQMRAIDQVSTIPQNGIVVPKGEPIYWWNNDEFNVNGILSVKNYIKSAIAENIKSKNMITGWFVGGLSSTNGAEDTNYANAFRTGYIDVDFTKISTYTVSGTPSSSYRHFIGAYNSNKQFLGRTGGNIVAGDTLTSSSFTNGTPQGTGTIKYLRICVYNTPPESALSTIQLEEGNTATTFYEGKGYGSIFGSNANGYYQKFDDGTLICWNRITISSVPITSSMGTLYVSGNLTNFGNYPITYIDTPIVTITSESDDNYVYCWAFKSVRPSATEVRGFRMVSYQSVTLTNLRITYIAIGRWK